MAGPICSFLKSTVLIQYDHFHKLDMRTSVHQGIQILAKICL
jgi:hypothetical protein